ncbi:hypothetical protein, partial [Rhizobium leguminosarum]|uniref:hypothetical protein n=1 Tax=Rhizobium leguminosarum TaxID=384 RepID=UPI003F978D2B
ITVFTTRPETLFGASDIVLSPEHPAVAAIVEPEMREAVAAYLAEAEGLEETVRADAGREKTGVFTGAYAINPANGARRP